MQDVKLYTQNAPQYKGDCEYRISSIYPIYPSSLNSGVERIRLEVFSHPTLTVAIREK